MKKWRTLIVLVAIAVIVLIVYRSVTAQRAQQSSTDLQTVAAERGSLTATIGATGEVRANQSAILSWQTTGTVGAVAVEVGQQVKAGEVLASLERTSLPQTVILAQADLVAAQRALDDLLNSQLQSASALKALEDAQKALEEGQDPALTVAEAQKTVTDAQKLVEQAERNVAWGQSPANQSYIDEAEAQVVLARDRLDRAKERFRPYADKPEDNLTRARLQSELSAAQQVYDAAVRKLNSLQGTASETDQAVSQSNLDAARAQLAVAQREYERVKDGLSEADLAVLQAQLDDARREYERVKDGPSAEDIESAEARVAAAEATLAQAQLTAPFAGTVTDVAARVGDQAAIGVQAFRLDDLSQLLVDVQVSEVDINRIEAGQEVTLSFDAIQGQEYHGIVEQVALVGTPTQGVVDFTVTVKLTDVDNQVLPGMTAAVNIVAQQLDDVLLVPNRAVRVVDGQRVVYVMRDASMEAVEISLGASSEEYSEVVEGELNEGDQIVLNPPSLLMTGGFMGN